MTLEFLLARARRKGPDKAFRAFVQTLPSCLSPSDKPRYSEWVNGEGRCVAAHVRRAAESGTAKKPDYCCVPLTFDEHNTQSWDGEAACLNKWIPRKGFWNELEAKDFFDEQRIYYLTLWINS